MFTLKKYCLLKIFFFKFKVLYVVKHILIDLLDDMEGKQLFHTHKAIFLKD